jgi:hypothetical protein
MHIFANQSSFGATAISGAISMYALPVVASPKSADVKWHKRR